jgi:PAS domain-containing protein
MQNLLRRRQRDAFEAKRRLVHLLRAFRNAAAALPDAVVVLDRERRILWFNTAAGSLLGLKYPQDIGGPLTNLVRAAARVADWLRGDASRAAAGSRRAESTTNLRLNLRLIRYADEQSLLIARDVSQADATGAGAPRLRRQRLARAAHAADRGARLSGHDRAGKHAGVRADPARSCASSRAG